MELRRGHLRSGFERLRHRWSSPPEPIREEPAPADGAEAIGADVARVCIVTPVFNGIDYIDETIQSVLSQSGDFVLHYHVQDGGSTDGTMACVEQWMHASRTMPRRCRKIVFTCVSERDAGMYDAINKGFVRALPPGGDVVMGWIAADDRLASGAFAAILAIRAKHPQIRLLGGRISLMDLNGSILGVNTLIPFAQRCMAAGLYDGRALNFVMQEGTFWCSDLWHKVGGLDTRFRLAGDWDLWRRMAAYEPYVSADTLLGFHRKRPGQLSEQMDRYYGEVDRLLDGEPGPGDQAASLRQAYEDAAIGYERIRRDPQRFHGSDYAARGVRYDLGTRSWTLIESIGLIPGVADLVTLAGTTESVPAHPTSGFRAAEGPYPEHALPAGIRWMDARRAEAELLLVRAGRYRIVVRCRSWSPAQSVILHADEQPLGRLAVTPRQHDRDLFLSAETTLAAGSHTLAITIDQPAHDLRYLLVIDWWAERQVDEDRAAILPVPARPIGLASRAAPPPDAAWPRLSLIVSTRDAGHSLHDMLQSIVRQGYPGLELIVLDAEPAEQTGRILRDFAGCIAHLVTGPDRAGGDPIDKGMRAASGTILGWLGGGDLLADGALHAVGHAFLMETSDLVAGACEVSDEYGVPLYRDLPQMRGGVLPLAELLEREGQWPRDRTLGAGQVFFTRAIWDRAGAIADGPRFAAGPVPWLQLARAGATIRTIGAPLVRRRPQANGADEAASRDPGARLRILFFSEAGFHIGAGSAQRRRAGALAALGHEVVLLGYADTRNGSPAHLIDARTVSDAIAAFAPDLVFAGTLNGSAGYLDVADALAERGIPTIVTADDVRLGGDRDHARRGKLGGAAHGRLAILANSRFVKRALTDAFDDAQPPVHVCPIGVDTQLFVRGDRWRARMLLDLPQDAFMIVTAAAADSLEQREGLALLVEAMELLGDARELMLIVIGSAPALGHPRFRARATRTIEDEALAALYYQAADLFVSPASDAACGQAVLDAGASELPAVVLDGGETAEAVLGGVTGVLVKERGAAALSAAIASLRSDAGLRRRLGVQARLHVVNQYSLEASAAALTSILVRETMPDLALAPGVRVAVERPPLPEPRYLVETTGPIPQRAPSWYPGRNFAEEQQPFDRPDLPRRFWLASWPDCAFLVTAASNGGHTLHMVVRSAAARQRLSVSINNGSARTLVLGDEERDTAEIVQIGVDLVRGFNRVAIAFADGYPGDEGSGSPAGLLFEDVAVWEGLPPSAEGPSAGGPGAEGLPEGAIGLLQGFEPPEGPYPEHGLPHLIRWASGRRCTVRTIAAVAGPRRWELHLSNNRPDQAIRIYVNNRLVASSTIEDLPLETVTRVPFEADMLAGANLVTIEADQVLESLADPRPLAFILVDLLMREDEEPAALRDTIRWDLSRSLSAPREVETERGSMLVRSIEARACTIVVERERRGTACLRLELVTALPAQTASLLVNGQPLRPLGLSTGAAGGVMQIERDVTLIGGRNTLQLRFELPAPQNGPFAGAFVYLSEVHVDRTGSGARAATDAASDAFAAVQG